ncbi:MAG TPA: four-carbon acid sugar kinase family protein, partial [Cyclobacteriaceae bacterium]|nr:four-carbon acid sugar kinase family protein [Cyclobacteriaceae bacterium]
SRQIPVNVIIEYRGQNIPELKPGNHEVLIINTESRHIQPAKAASRIRNIIIRAKASGVKYFYKKTDSTLRGNIGPELSAFLECIGCRQMSFIPANPGQKRYTRNGYQYLGNKLLHKTSFANDPFEPVRTSFIPDILQKWFDPKILLVSRNDMERQSHILFPANGIMVIDCISEKDLATAGKFLKRNRSLEAISGSAAFIKHLPSLLKLPKRKRTIKIPVGPVLVINGSVNQIALKQVRYVIKKGMEPIILSKKLLSGRGNNYEAHMAQLRELIKKDFKKKDILISSTDPVSPKDVSISQSATKRPTSVNNTALRIGHVAYRLLKLMKIEKVLIIGGDTLAGLMKVMHCRQIEPLSELLPGVALSIINHRGNKVFLFTKPGGFGEEDVIGKILIKAGYFQK